MSSPSYQDSYQQAKGHSKALFQSTIGAHPTATAAVVGVLVVLIIVLGYYVVHYKSKASSSAHGFRVGIAPYNNLNMNGNNPMWYLGSEDAGNWGPMHREPTAYNVAAYVPGWRGDARRGMRRGDNMRGRREGLEAGGAVATEAGAAPVDMPAAPPAPMSSPFPQVGPRDVCGRGWDPAASAEAQALATTGALQHDSYGEGNLQGAIDGAYDSGVGLNDDQLVQLMHQGGAP
jgi:hypothetical protein